MAALRAEEALLRRLGGILLTWDLRYFLFFSVAYSFRDICDEIIDAVTFQITMYGRAMIVNVLLPHSI